jgi:hypothetical protein
MSASAVEVSLDSINPDHVSRSTDGDTFAPMVSSMLVAASASAAERLASSSARTRASAVPALRH